MLWAQLPLSLIASFSPSPSFFVLSQIDSFIEETYVVCKTRSLRLSLSDHDLKRKQSRYGLDSSSADYQILAIQRFLRLFISDNAMVSRTFIIVCAILTIFLNIQRPFTFSWVFISGPRLICIVHK